MCSSVLADLSGLAASVAARGDGQTVQRLRRRFELRLNQQIINISRRPIQYQLLHVRCILLGAQCQIFDVQTHMHVYRWGDHEKAQDHSGGKKGDRTGAAADARENRAALDKMSESSGLGGPSR
jgi:hypothetical protein